LCVIDVHIITSWYNVQLMPVIRTVITALQSAGPHQYVKQWAYLCCYRTHISSSNHQAAVCRTLYRTKI